MATPSPTPKLYILFQLFNFYELLKTNSARYFSRYSPFKKSLTISRWVVNRFLSRLTKNNCMIFDAIKIKYSTASTAFPPCTKQCSKPHSLFKLLKIEFSISQRALIILNSVLSAISIHVVTIIICVRCLLVCLMEI